MLRLRKHPNPAAWQHQLQAVQLPRHLRQVPLLARLRHCYHPTHRHLLRHQQLRHRQRRAPGTEIRLLSPFHLWYFSWGSSFPILSEVPAQWIYPLAVTDIGAFFHFLEIIHRPITLIHSLSMLRVRFLATANTLEMDNRFDSEYLPP